jgi:hypothetical protein
VGCSDPLQEGGKVKVDYDRLSTVGDITVGPTTETPNKVIASWKAVEDASGYNIFLQEEGKKTIIAVPGATPRSLVPYKADGTDDTDSKEVDNWYVKFSFPTDKTVEGNKYFVGVQAVSPTSKEAGGVSNSDIKWSEKTVTADH